MAYTLTGVTSRVQDKLDNTSFTASKIYQFINDAQRELIVRLKPTEAFAEGSWSSSAGSDSLSTAVTDMLVPISFRITSPTNYAKVIPYADFQDLDAMSPNVTLVGNGAPQAWYRYGTAIKVYPQADATYTIKGRYIKVPAELTSGSDVPLLPEVYGEVLVLGAYKRCLEHDDDFDQAQVIQQQIDAMLLDIVQMTKPQIGVPHIMRAPRSRRIIGQV